MVTATNRFVSFTKNDLYYWQNWFVTITNYILSSRPLSCLAKPQITGIIVEYKVFEVHWKRNAHVIQHIVSALVSRNSNVANIMCEWRDFDQLGSKIFSKWAHCFSIHVNIKHKHKQTSMPTSHVQSDNCVRSTSASHISYAHTVFHTLQVKFATIYFIKKNFQLIHWNAYLRTLKVFKKDVINHGELSYRHSQN